MSIFRDIPRHISGRWLAAGFVGLVVGFVLAALLLGGSDAPEEPPDVTPSAAPIDDSLPSGVLDLRNWRLTVPIGDAEDPDEANEIDQPELSSYQQPEVFHVNRSGTGVVFRAAAGGATTDGSHYPRSELREMTHGGREEAKWSSKGGEHVMTITQAITAVPEAKPAVVAGQIHDGEDDVVTVRLQGRRLFVDADGDEAGVLDKNYRLGTKFTVEFRADRDGISVTYNGARRVVVDETGDSYYFKAGCYTQSQDRPKGDDDEDSDGPYDEPSAYGEVVIYQLAVRHE